MEQLNIKTLIEVYDLKAKDVAKVLFPCNEYPMNALNRIIKKDIPINSKQISDLAAYIGVPVGDLFRYTDGWKGSYEDGHFVLNKGDVRASLYNGVLSIVKDGKQITHELVQTKLITVSGFIEYISKIINKKS